MTNRNRIQLILYIIAASLVMDQITKKIAESTLKYSSEISYLGDFFVFRYAENSGAMLGFASDLPESLRFWFLTVFVGLLMLALLVYLFRSNKITTTQTIALSLISGGGLGNWIDRLVNDGWVVDFMHMGIGFLRTGIFNVADVLIMVGLGMMLVFGEWSSKQKEESPSNGGSTANPDIS